MTTRELADRVAEGDDAAFELLYVRLAPGLQSFFFHHGWSRAEAEDGSQEVFLKLWQKRRTLRRSGSPEGLVYRIARNLWVDSGRARRVHAQWEAARVESADTDGVEDPSNALEYSEEYQRVLKVIDQLPEHLRMVLLLKKVAGLKGADIASVMGIPAGTVASRLHHAIVRVREMIEAKGLRRGPMP